MVEVFTLTHNLGFWMCSTGWFKLNCFRSQCSPTVRGRPQNKSGWVGSFAGSPLCCVRRWLICCPWWQISASVNICCHQPERFSAKEVCEKKMMLRSLDFSTCWSCGTLCVHSWGSHYFDQLKPEDGIKMDACVIKRVIINIKQSSCSSKGQRNFWPFRKFNQFSTDSMLVQCPLSVIHCKDGHDVDCQYQDDHYRDLKAEISFLISLTSSSVTPSFSAFRCSWVGKTVIAFIICLRHSFKQLKSQPLSPLPLHL